MKCITGLFNYGRVKCPFDAKQFHYGSVQDIGRNFDLQDAMTIHETILQQKMASADGSHPLCIHHQTKKVKFFCECSNQLACSECLVSRHPLGNKSHTLYPIQDVLNHIPERISEKASLCEAKIYSLMKQTDRSKAMLSTYHQKMRKLVQEAGENLL